MKNGEYWQERFRQLEEAQNKLAQASVKEIEAQYRSAVKELEGKINTWYQRLAKNNGISMAEARKLLDKGELEEFKWSVWDYIKHGEENALSGQWVKQLENASAKFHISKYQALMIDTQQTFEKMFGQQLRTVEDTLGKVYEGGYYKTVYELQKGLNAGFNVGKINEEELREVLSKPWAVDGKNFSDRIWGNKEKLVNELHNELTQNIITGADPQKAIDNIAKKMNTSKSNAGRLVMTEAAYFRSVAEGKSYVEMGIEKYKISATLDHLTSEICQEMDGKVFETKDFKPGVTAHPFHVRCRSTTVPYLDEELWGKGEGKRAARGEDGKTYYVPDDMTYPEWKRKYVDGDEEYEDKDKKEAEDRGRKAVEDFWKETEKENRSGEGSGGGFSETANVTDTASVSEAANISEAANGVDFGEESGIIKESTLTTSKEIGITRVNECEDFKSLGDYMTKRYDVFVDSDVENLDFSSVRLGLTGFEKVANDFPDIAKNLEKIDAKSAAIATSNGKKISFGKVYYSDPNKFQEAMESGKRNNSYAIKDNRNQADNIAHESGHLIVSAIVDKKYDNTPMGRYLSSEDWNKGKTSNDILNAAIKELKKMPDYKNKSGGSILSEFSMYVYTSSKASRGHEAIAEAVSDYYKNKSKAHPLSKVIIKLLKAEF